jgi:hypothetical protein
MPRLLAALGFWSTSADAISKPVDFEDDIAAFLTLSPF